MLIAVARPEPESNTMLPDTMRACSDRVFGFRLFTKLLKLRFSQEKEKLIPDFVILLTPLYDAFSDNLAAPRRGLARISPIGDNPNDSQLLLTKYLCSIV
jgi:hypothetical protein